MIVNTLLTFVSLLFCSCHAESLQRDDTNAIDGFHHRKLQTSAPLVSGAISKSVLNVLKQFAITAVSKFDAASLLGSGLGFQLPATDNFVFALTTELPQLTPFTDDSIMFDILRDPVNPNNSILLQVGVLNLEATFPSIAVKATGTFTQPVALSFTCDIAWVNLKFTLPAPSGISVTLKTTATGSQISAVVDKTSINLDTLSFPLSSGYTVTGDPLCTQFKAQIDGAIVSAEGTLINQIKTLLNDSFINTFTSNLVNLSFNIPAFPLGSGDIDLGIGFDLFGVTDDNNRVQFAISAAPKAMIKTIPHRQNFFYTPTIEANDVVLAIPAITDKTLAATAAVDGVNGLIASAFYLIWAELTVNSTSIESKACEAIPSDPCPFPELELSTLVREPNDPVFKIAFLALRRYFRRGGFYNSFRINAAVQPPEITVSDDSIGGTVVASIYVQATKRFLFDGEIRDMAKLDFPLIFEVDVPTLANDGTIQNVSIKKLSVGKWRDGLDFNFYQFFPFQPTLRGRIALRFILLPIVRRAIPLFYKPINDAIANATIGIVIPLSLGPVQFGNVTFEPKISDVVLDPDGDTSTLSASANFQL